MKLQRPRGIKPFSFISSTHLTARHWIRTVFRCGAMRRTQRLSYIDCTNICAQNHKTHDEQLWTLSLKATSHDCRNQLTHDWRKIDSIFFELIPKITRLTQICVDSCKMGQLPYIGKLMFYFVFASKESMDIILSAISSLFSLGK